MEKFIVVISAIFEFIFYTFFMVLVDSFQITNKILDLLVHFLGLFVVSCIFYFLMRIILQKLNVQINKYIYYVVVLNLIFGLVVPILLIFIIPSEKIITFSFLVLVSSIYYGLLINAFLCIFNFFFTNRTKKLG